MREIVYSDSYLREILKSVKTIAIVGISDKEDRPSYRIMRFMQRNGYRVIPVNPFLAGTQILSETVYDTLTNIPISYEMVDIFRSSDAVSSLVDEVIYLLSTKSISVIWMQLGVHNPAAAERAAAVGLRVVMNRCLKIEIERLILPERCMS